MLRNSGAICTPKLLKEADKDPDCLREKLEFSYQPE